MSSKGRKKMKKVEFSRCITNRCTYLKGKLKPKCDDKKKPESRIPQPNNPALEGIGNNQGDKKTIIIKDISEVQYPIVNNKVQLYPLNKPYLKKKIESEGDLQNNKTEEQQRYSSSMKKQETLKKTTTVSEEETNLEATVYSVDESYLGNNIENESNSQNIKTEIQRGNSLSMGKNEPFINNTAVSEKENSSEASIDDGLKEIDNLVPMRSDSKDREKNHNKERYTIKNEDIKNEKRRRSTSQDKRRDQERKSRERSKDNHRDGKRKNQGRSRSKAKHKNREHKSRERSLNGTNRHEVKHKRRDRSKSRNKHKKSKKIKEEVGAEA